jgi:carbonic anhydrase
VEEVEMTLYMLSLTALASGGPDAHGNDPHDGSAEVHAPQHRAHKKAKHEAPQPAHADQSHAHWTYEGAEGPEHWGELSPEWAKCSTGHAQTPIDINHAYAEPIGLDDVVFHYHPLQSNILNNGHTIQVNLPQGDAIEVDGDYYELAQFHFHAPSEHKLDGRRYPIELHLVHKDAKGNLAVVGIFLEEGAENKGLDPVFATMELKAGQEKPIASELDVSLFLPPDHEMMRYTGSLTTPPCSEGVRWIVFTQPVTASAEQLGRFQKMYDHNARPIQALNGRTLLQDATK